MRFTSTSPGELDEKESWARKPVRRTPELIPFEKRWSEESAAFERKAGQL